MHKRRCLIRPLALLLIARATTTAAQSTAFLPAVNRARLDTTCAPCKDFYRFANGAWLDSVAIPKVANRWGPLLELQARNNNVVRQILDSLAFAPGHHADTPLERKIGTYYRACMDSTVPTRVALTGLEPELRRIAQIRTPSDLGGAVGRLWRHRVFTVFWLVDITDDFDPTRIIAGVRGFQSALTLSSRVYLRADSASARTRDAYIGMLARVFEVLGDLPDTAASNARRVLDLETALARSQPIDSGPVNHNLSLAQLRRIGTAFDWQAFARGLGRPDLPGLNLRPRPIARTIDSLAASQPLEQWRAYLRWRLVFELGQVGPIHRATDPFFQMVSGRQQSPTLAERCASTTTRWFGDGVAQAFVRRTFSVQARSAAQSMAEGFRQVLQERIAAVDWLGPSRHRALAKLAAITMQIGYPDSWQDYGAVEVRDGAAIANEMAARRYNMDRRIARVGPRPDRVPSEGTATTFALGEYGAAGNELLLTAGLLQPPFFDLHRDPAATYGTIGQVIGHELTHAFDSGGRLYNESGKRDDWWAPGEVQEYTRRAELLVQQYDAYVISDSLHQNGRTTLSENIADIGGVALAYLAFQRAVAGKPRESLNGFTPEQRFFIAYAQSINTEVWRPELTRSQAQVDQYTHSAPKWRVNGPLANLPAFAAAFECKEDDPMVRPAPLRWSIW